MKEIENIIGKEFESPISGECYAFDTLFDGSYPAHFSVDRFGIPFAGDSSGNLFTQRNDKKVYFWDHEIDEILMIAASFDELYAGVVEPASIELQEGQVKSVWIDPEFAKQLGIEVPSDGWKKKES